MRNYTNSETVQYHDDGSYTVSSEVTHYPPTKQEKAAAWTALTLVTVGPSLFMLAPLVYETFKEKREARKAEKARLKAVK